MKLTPKLSEGIVAWMDENNLVQSLDPPDAWEGFSAFTLMRPPIKPKNMLIIGVAMNTLGRYCHQKWPDLPITLVDIEPKIEGVIEADGFEYLMNCENDSFDTVVVDAFIEGVLAPFVSKKEFVGKMRRVAENCILNISDREAEAITPWLKSQVWRVQQYRKTHQNNIWFLRRKPIP